jgi:hypothetical protein
MNKLSKDQIRDKAKHVEAIRLAHTDLADSILVFNKAMEAAWADVENAQEKYNATITEANDFVVGLAEKARAYFDEKSEKWQEGEKGEAHNAWVEDLESISLDEADLSCPDPIDEPDSEADRLDDDLTEAPES